MHSKLEQKVYKIKRKFLSFSQQAYSLFGADKDTNPETAGRTAIENIYHTNFIVN